MSLRIRLALVFALLAVLVAGLMGLMSYAVAADRLEREADTALAQVAAPYVAALRDGRPLEFGRRGRDDVRFGLYPVQLLQPDGTTSHVAGPRIALPATDADRELATAQRPGSSSRTDRVAGVPVRMLTATPGLQRGAIQVARDWSDSRTVLRSLAATLSLIGAGVVVLAAAGGWLLARRLTDRLTALTEAAEVVGASGRLDIPVPGSGTDEVGRLSAAFDQMLRRLAASREQQHRLVQDVGHELRTPLTSLRTNVELLRHFERLSEADRERVIADLAGETGELSTLVDEVIDLGTDAPLNPEPSLVRLAAVAGAAAERARRRTGREVALRTDDSVVLGNAATLLRAVWNLVDNAVKFAPDGPIEVTVERGAVSVTDHGPGIAARDLPHLFDRFYRSDQARSRPGSGLGLSIVAEIARSHGGEVWAGNRTDGRTGAEVAIRLPLQEASTGGAAQPRSGG